MTKFTDSREQILVGFDTLRGLSHVPGEYLSLRVALYRAQIAAYDAFVPGLAVPELPLSPAGFKPDDVISARIIAQTEDSLTDNQVLKSRLQKLMGNGDILVKMAEAAAFGPDQQALERMAGETGCALEELLFFGRALAAPYLSRMIASAADLSVPPDAQFCPYCGSEPGLSILRGEHGRFLVCSLCGSEWRFLRTRCPFCAADNSLEIISEGGEAPHWIESCVQCKCYLKTFDQQRHGDQITPLLAIVSTLYLDIIAEKEGCQPGLPYVAIR